MELTEADLAFLRSTLTGPVTSAVNAARFLGAVAEEFPGDVRVGQLLEAFVEHEQPVVRVAALEAMWQGHLRTSVGALERRQFVEEHPAVRTTLEYVLKVLRS